MSAPSHRGLSRRQVLDGALALVDAQGAGALTMRNLGRELGVEAMSLYHHVRNREDLLDGLAEIMVAEIPTGTDDQPWADAVRDFAAGIRTVALRHPAAFHLVGLRPLRTAAALAAVGGLLRRLRAAGLPAETAVAVYRLAAAYARGFALAEIAGFTLEPSHDTTVVLPDDLAGLPDDLAELAPLLGGSHDRTFARGVELIVAGARAAG